MRRARSFGTARGSPRLPEGSLLVESDPSPSNLSRCVAKNSYIGHCGHNGGSITRNDGGGGGGTRLS